MIENKEIDLIVQQKEICNKYGFMFEPSNLNFRVDVSLDVKNNEQPINALRYSSNEGTTGWYIWTGEYSGTDDFFKPLHVVHLYSYCPLILPYLGLPEGCRVLIAKDGNYVEVWRNNKSIMLV